MRVSKNTIVFLLIFSIVCISITIAAILYTKYTWKDQSSAVILENKRISSTENNKQNIQIETTSNDITSLDDTYKTNALDIKDNIYRNGDTVKKEKYNEKLKINYPEISGLADINIKTDINNKIREKVFSMYNEEELKDSNIEHIEISANATASFSDILSVKILANRNYSDGTEKKQYAGLNYRLENGEEIKFKNLFITGASIKNILRHSAYNSFAWEYKNDRITNMKNVDYSNIDDLVFKALNDYSKSENHNYWFDSKKISIELADRIVEIPMMNCYEQIAIYKRYISKNNLYLATSMANNIPIFVDRDEYSLMDIYMVVDNNLIIDISLDTSEIDTSLEAVNKALENYKKALNDATDRLKKNSKEKNNEYTYFISRITAKIDLENNKIIFNENTYKYIADNKTKFDVYIVSPILNDKRTSLYGDNKTKFDLKQRNIKIQKLTNVVEYNLQTGELFENEKIEKNNNEQPDYNDNNTQNNDNQNEVNNNETNNVQDNNNTIDNSSNTTGNVVNETIHNNGDDDNDDESTRVIF